MDITKGIGTIQMDKIIETTFLRVKDYKNAKIKVKINKWVRI